LSFSACLGIQFYDNDMVDPESSLPVGRQVQDDKASSE